MDALIIVIIIASAAYLVWRFRRNLSGCGGCGCGCDCGSGCGQNGRSSCEQNQGGRNARSGPFPMAPGNGRKPGRDA